MNYTTVERVLMHLNIESPTPYEVIQITDLVPLANAEIKNYVGWEMLSTTYTNRAYVGDGTAYLSLRLWPVNTVTNVTLDGVDITTAVTFSAEDGILEYVDNVFTLNGRILVTFNAGVGYTDTSVVPNVTAEIPGELIYCATHLVATKAKAIFQEWLGIDEGKFQSEDIKLTSGDLPKLVTRYLNRYRMLRIY